MAHVSDHGERRPAGDTSESGNTPRMDPDSLFTRIADGDRTALARGITLIESRHPDDVDARMRLLDHCRATPETSFRIAVTGLPGAGKSTLIERLGLLLIESGHRVAVLAVDPSSELSGGSILGDKTRMERLSVHPDAFIRPSPGSAAFGGVTEVTRESILLCETAGFDRVIVETIGVGQGEYAVHSMTDFFLLVTIAGTGDELQGIKRGIMEMTDGIFVNKADGDQVAASKRARSILESTLRLAPNRSDGWKRAVLTGSAMTGDGMVDLTQMLDTFEKQARSKGSFEERRIRQRTDWFEDAVTHRLRLYIETDPELVDLRSSLRTDVLCGKVDPISAAGAFVRAVSRIRTRPD